MRTRLDEIVEEVLSTWYSRSSPQMPPPTVNFSRDLVASLMATSNERAFRHGVERMNGQWRLHSNEIQPAPAEEKCPDSWDFGNGWLRCDREKGHGIPHRASKKLTEEVFQPAPAEERCNRGVFSCCGGRNGHTGPCQPDPERRKGERRNPLTPSYGTVREDGKPDRRIWRTVSISWQYDRRSGKDRRKP